MSKEFALSPKERFAQLQKAQQEKNGGPKAPGKLNATSKPGAADKNKDPATPTKEPEKPKVEPAKPKEEAKKTTEVKNKPETKKVEPEKPKAEPAKPPTNKPAEAPKPAEAAKPGTNKAAEPAVSKPTEPAKPAVSKPTEPAKPAEQAKSAASKPTEAVKPKEEKPKEEPKKAQPGKMDLDLDAEMKANAAKIADNNKAANSPAPAASKPAEQQKPAAAPAPAPAAAASAPAAAKPAEQPKPAAAPNPAPVAAPSQTAAPTPVAAPAPAVPPVQAKPVEQPKPAAAPVPATANPAPAPAATNPAAAAPPRPNEDFFTNIFYFSGMGSLIGSALAEGVYVPERNQRNALDAEEIEAAKERSRVKGEEVIVTARSQAQGLSTDFRHLQSLLDTLPTFTDTLNPQALDKRGIDQPIHGHRYFRQTDTSSHSRQEISEGGRRSAGPPGGVQVYPPNESDVYYQQQRDRQRQQEEEAARYRDRQRQEEEQRHRDRQRQEEEQRYRQRQEEEARRRQLEAEQRAAALSASANQGSSRSPVPPTSRSPYQHENGYAGGRSSRGPEGASDGYGVGRSRVPGDPDAAAQQAWQDKYNLRDGGQRQPTPRRQKQDDIEYRDAGDVDTSGIKPWQMSHIRSLEAKGYHIIDHEGEPTGNSWSYSPYLNTDRSKNIDLQQQRAGSVGRPLPAPQQHQARQGQPYGSTGSQPGYGGGYQAFNDTSLPYCDL